MVFYRKYRPQTIEELDSKEVREKLYSVLSSQNTSHAFLFTGPKGLGKTSAARIVAKAVNCENKLKVENGKLKIKNKENSQLSTLNSQLRRIEPCNKCHQCISITNGTNIDVLEIDGASNRGIDEIRDLREKVRLSPASAKKKVYIIDEVHMLTTEAFNALLKTLEEPPNHVVFILCTTEPHKVPATIVSRCFHVQFEKATIEELVRSFERIVKMEKLNADKESLQLIASLSDGSFRDGVKILEEITLVGEGKKITKELVEEKYKISSINHKVSEMIGYLGKKNTKRGLELTSRLIEQGIDMKHFIEQLISQLHEALMVEVGVGKAERKMDPSASLRLRGSDSRSSGGRWKMEEIRELVELLVKAHMELKYSVLPQLPLEMVVVEWGMRGSVGSAEVAPHHTVQGSPRQNDTSTSDNFWQELIGKVKLYNHSIAGILRGCALKEFDEKNVIIETKYKFHKEKLSEAKTQEIIEKACREVKKKDIKVKILLTGGE